MTDPAASPGSPAPVVRRIEVPRSARYFLLGGEGTVREVWFVLHGFGMLAGKFIRWFAPAAAPHRLIVAPEALNHYYTKHEARKVGATWMTSEDREAEIGDYVRYLNLVLAEVLSSLGTAPAPSLEVHGFSQGTATATRWVAMGQPHPARLVLWAGGIPPDLDLTAHGAALSQANLTLVLGDRDEYIVEERIQAEQQRLAEAGVRFTLLRFQGGHVVPWPVLQALARQGSGATP
jgi:predicted esterase